MNKQYFLLVKSFTGMNSKPVEHAIVDKLRKTLDQTVWNNGKEALRAHIEKLIGDTEKELNDDIMMNFIDDLQTEEDLNFLCFGIFRVRAFEVRNANPRYHIQMPSDFLPRKYAGWNKLTKQEQNQRVELEMKKVSAFLDGSYPQANCMITTFQKEFEGWKIEVLDYRHEVLNPESGYTSEDFGVRFKEIEEKEAPNG